MANSDKTFKIAFEHWLTDGCVLPTSASRFLYSKLATWFGRHMWNNPLRFAGICRVVGLQQCLEEGGRRGSVGEDCGSLFLLFTLIVAGTARGGLLILDSVIFRLKSRRRIVRMTRKLNSSTLFMETSLLRFRRRPPHHPSLRRLFGRGLVGPRVRVLRVLQSPRHHTRTVRPYHEEDATFPLWPSHPLWDPKRWRAEGALEEDVQHLRNVTLSRLRRTVMGA